VRNAERGKHPRDAASLLRRGGGEALSQDGAVRVDTHLPPRLGIDEPHLADVGEFLLVQRAGHGWPRAARIGMLVFQVVQAIALIGTRGHYTIDIVVAIPFAIVADLSALALLARLPGARAQPAQLRASAPA